MTRVAWDSVKAACYADQREVAENDDPVSRRQFFRGLTGDLLKVMGEVTGLGLESEQQPVADFGDGDALVPPGKQTATLSDLFGFLEQLGAQQEAARDAAPEPEAERP